MAKYFISLAALIVLFLPVIAAGEHLTESTTNAVPAVTTPAIDTVDTAWILISTALVMLMTPDLALFYGGMVRVKNVLGTLMQSFVAIALISVQWILFGYSLSFGPDINGIIGSLDWIGLNGVGIEPNPDYAPTIPHMAFMMYQAMFAVITPALITGAFAERMKFSAYVIFILLWSTVVYDPVAHWVWGTGGWLKQMGVLDFAGGIVVHLISGISALAAALMIGKRNGYLQEAMYPHYSYPRGNLNLRADSLELERLAQAIGSDGAYLLESVSGKASLADLPEVTSLRQVWEEQYELVEGEVLWKKETCTNCSLISRF